ncbi:uncharacterized protein LOC112685060 [Sipha flava]|jgi:hypothetical protein|uniref:Uncharacterized protein LOC112685060 n=1 Tax=Sipha flava TaxID=143950 RepID=A0A8B8FNU8_9HEMI|nr:uncharacterized protein LOC112685060 [Sipha flava]
MYLGRLIIITTYFYYVYGNLGQKLKEVQRFKLKEKQSSGRAYSDHFDKLRAEYEKNEDNHKKYKAIIKEVYDELEYQAWSIHLFLNNIDLRNNNIFFQNGTCRHDAYGQYKVLYHYFVAYTRLHPSRIDPFVKRLNKRFNDEIKYLRKENDEFKKSFKSCKRKHDDNLKILPVP